MGRGRVNGGTIHLEPTPSVPSLPMPNEPRSNKCTPSTTYAWRKVRISRAPQAETTVPRQGRPVQALAQRDPRKPLSITISYRGGAESWWELRARGVVLRRPGSVCLDDVLSLLSR